MSDSMFNSFLHNIFEDGLKELVDNIFADFSSDSTPEDYLLRRGDSIRVFCNKVSSNSNATQLVGYIREVQSCMKEDGSFLLRYSNRGVNRGVIRSILAQIKEGLEGVKPSDIDPCLHMYVAPQPEWRLGHSFGTSVDRPRDSMVINDDILNRGENMNTTVEELRLLSKNTEYLLEKYQEAVKQLDMELFICSMEAKPCVLNAILYIGRHIGENNYCGTKALISKIKLCPAFKSGGDRTLYVAIYILNEWMTWYDSKEWGNGPNGMRIESIKKAIKSFGNGSASLAITSEGENAKFIKGLRDNPNGSEYLKEDIRAGMLVKVYDGMEKFWVEVTDDTGSCLIFGNIISNIVGDNGYGRGDKIAFYPSEVWRVKPPEPKAGLILGVSKEDFSGVMMECYHELVSTPLNADIRSAVYLIKNLVSSGMGVNQVMTELTRPKPIGFYDRSPPVLGRNMKIDEIAANIMTDISDRYKELGTFHLLFLKMQPRALLKAHIITPAIKKAVSKVVAVLNNTCNPEDTFKPGDRVCFIKQNIYRSDGPDSRNCYLGIVNTWSVQCSYGGEKSCYLINDENKAFHVLPMETLRLNVESQRDVQELVEHADFEKSLIPSCDKIIKGANVTLCPVDEKHFPSLNKIAAKLRAEYRFKLRTQVDG